VFLYVLFHVFCQLGPNVREPLRRGPLTAGPSRNYFSPELALDAATTKRAVVVPIEPIIGPRPASPSLRAGPP